jgi:protein SCO1
MYLFMRKWTLIILCSLFFISILTAQDIRFGIVEKTGDILPGNVMLTNEDSVSVKFGDLVDKPTLLSFVYYKCPGLCSPVMDGIAEVIEKSDLRLGKDYQVITISVNYKEPISLARAKKASYMKALRSVNAWRYWQFYVADSAAVKKLTDAAGWEFKRTGNDFVHAAATIMITPHRKISQYFYGTYILPMHFHLAVNDARSELTDASRLNDQKYCYNFTPPVNKAYSLIVSSTGIGILILGAFLFIWLSLTPRSK